MKKRKLKKWVKEFLLSVVLFIIGFGCVFAMAKRAEQINRSTGYETNYKINN